MSTPESQMIDELSAALLDTTKALQEVLGAIDFALEVCEDDEIAAYFLRAWRNVDVEALRAAFPAYIIPKRMLGEEN